MSLLDDLHKKILTCTECTLHVGRKNAVPGEGRPDADIMFVGEGPGAEEDEQGRPFVGRSGQLLTQMLTQVGIERQSVFIGNIVKCRPWQKNAETGAIENRKPAPEEMHTCIHYLHAQIALINPKLLVFLGGTALEAFFGPKYILSRVIGQFIRYHGQPVFVTWHPSFVLRSPRNRADYLKHFKKIRQLADRSFQFPEK